MAQSFTTEHRRHNALDNPMCLEKEEDLIDLVAFFQEHFGTSNEEQQQDLRDFEAGTLDFEALYSKYWNEDGSWKDDFDNLQEHLQALNISKHGTSSKHHQPAAAIATPDSDVHDSELRSCGGADAMDID